MSDKDIIQPEDNADNELNMTDEVPLDPYGGNPYLEDRSNWSEQTIIEENPFLLKMIDKLNHLKQYDQTFEGLIKMNNLITNIIKDAQGETMASAPFICLSSHVTKIEEDTFDWVFEHANLPVISKVFELFDVFSKDQHFKYINFEQIREIMPIKLFTSYLSKPFSANEEDVVSYGEIIGFHSLVLSVFTKLYIRAFMALRPYIDATEIFTIDPFMRNEYRKNNLAYFIENFWGDEDFELYGFLEKLIDSYVLAGLPKWVLAQGKPFLVPLLEFIELLFGYGLISYEYCKPLLRFLYLTSETLKSLEVNVSQMDTQSVDLTKCRREFVECRERMSAILIHTFTLFSDAALEENLIELNSNVQKIDYFKSFLFSDKASFNYFSSIVIKYLCNYIYIDGDIDSDTINSNLVIIFNFIGDFQKDGFVLSMELVNKEYHRYYGSMFTNSISASEYYFRAQEICNIVKRFAEQMQYTTTQYFTEEFEKMINKVHELMEPYLANSDFKLELSVNNFVSLWLSIIELQHDNCDIAIIDKALTVLMHVLKGNFPGQSVLFRGNGYKTFFNILMKHTFSSLILLRRVFEDNAFLLYMSHDMFIVNLNVYTEKITDLEMAIKDLPDDLVGIENIPDISNKIGVLFYFNLYFDSVLEDHVIKINRRKRYDTLLAAEMVELVSRMVIPKLQYIGSQNNSDLNLISDILNYNIEQRPEIIRRLSETDPKILITQLCYFMLKLFNKSTFKLYGGKIYQSINNCNINTSMSQMAFASPQSILLRLEFVKLFDRFYVFYPNHLMTQRTTYNTHNTLYVGEYYIPSNYDTIKTFILNEFTWFDNYMSHHTNKNEIMLRHIKKYLFKGLLALIYKFLKGVSVHITKLQDLITISNLKDITDVIIDELTPRMAQFRRLLGPAQVTNPLGKLAGIFNKGKSKDNAEDVSYKGIGAKVSSITTFEVDENDNIEERINPNIKVVRTNVSKAIKELSAIFNGTDFEYHILRCVRESMDEENTEFMKKVFRNSESIRKDFGVTIEDAGKLNNYASFSMQFKRLKHEYKRVKIGYQKNRDENQFLVVLSSIKDAKSNLQNIIRYFANHFEMLSFNDSYTTPKNFYLNNEFFFSSIVILDNLSVWNSSVKKEFLEILMNMDEAKRVTILENLWGTYISLYLLIIFKTFMDKEWESFWSLFYILSTFIQNLCEENYIEFKMFFNNTNYAKGSISHFTNKNYTQKNCSIFFESYILLENAINFTEFWITDSPQIVPSDRAELFPIFKRLFSQVTEFITGPCLNNQLAIYRYRIDLWNGILNRLVDDIDSKFYDVKLACLNFLSALLEGQNNEIVTFMGSNLQINKLFNMITRLTKKLYVRQMLTNKKTNKAEEVKKNITNILVDVIKTRQSIMPYSSVSKLGSVTEISEEQEKAYKIDHYTQLIKMYMRYNENFSEHIILNVVITTYVMLINMSFKLKFYEFFLKDKEIDSEAFIKNPHSVDPSKVEEVIIYLFLQNITANIEVVYDKDEERRLIRIFYRIPPECFFLTDDMRTDFIESVDFSSTQSKHIDLFDSIDPLHIEMKTNKRYYEKYGDFYIMTTNDFFKLNQIFLYLMSFALNILMLIFLTSEGSTEDNLVSDPTGGFDVIEIVSIIIAVYSGLLTVLWLMFKYKIEIQCAESRYMVYHKVMKKQAKLKIRVFECLFFQPRFISFYLHFIFTILGLALNEPFFYTLNLFLLTNLLKTVNYVLQSIVKHYGKLFVTFVLTILVIFCYSFILMRYYRENVNDDDYDLNVCKDFLHCFLNSVNLGLRLGGGVSDAFYLAARIGEGGIFYGRFFFDLTFFILIKLIFLNLIAGIIIDTFSDMRDELTQRSYDMHNVCFICGKSRWQIEKDGISFRQHIGVDHSTWKYLYYMIRLESVQSSSFDGIEQYIYEKTRKDDSSWIPQNVYLKQNVNYKILKKEDMEDNNTE